MLDAVFVDFFFSCTLQEDEKHCRYIKKMGEDDLSNSPHAPINNGGTKYNPFVRFAPRLLRCAAANIPLIK